MRLQAHRRGTPVTFLYGSSEGRVGLFVYCEDTDVEFVSGPITANYPNCTFTCVACLPSGSNRKSRYEELGAAKTERPA